MSLQTPIKIHKWCDVSESKMFYTCFLPPILSAALTEQNAIAVKREVEA